MADLVLGLAKSAVEGTLSAAKSAIEEEKKLKESMQRDLMLITDELEMMQSFLHAAKERAAADEMVGTLVRQVRNMALDVEDCIESAVLVDMNKDYWWRRLIPSCMLPEAPAAALDKAVTAAQLLKSRVEAMGQRNERYIHMGDSGSKPTEKTHQQAVADAAAAGILIEARNAKKRHGSPRDFVELINNKDHVLPLQVISVWGAAGDLGVASIINKTRDDPGICSKFSCRAWVKLTQPFNPHEFIRSLTAQFYTNLHEQRSAEDLLTKPFNPREFIRNLMAQFYTNLPQGQRSAEDLRKQIDAMMAMEGTKLTEEFVKLLSNQRYLIFLEDVSTTVHWEAVRLYFPDKKNGSCIVVHSQQLEVASLVVGKSQQVLELEQFSDEHSVCVFFNEKRSCPRYLIELINKKNEIHSPLQVISVCGEIEDLRVASILNTCDKNPDFCKNFNYRAWVKLMHPFNHDEFIRSLLNQLYTNYCQRHASAEDFMKLKYAMVDAAGGVLIKEFVKQQMNNQRYVVFLEDVSSRDDWNAVSEYLPDKTNGSCIVVQTKQREVASFCVGQSHQLLELELFSDAHPVRVFIKEGEDEERAIKMKAAEEWLQNNPLAGRATDADNLNANDRGVRFVSGIAGVGKSYLVRNVYFRKVIKDKTFEKFSWVDISHLFSIMDFSWRLLLDLHSGSLRHANMLRIRDPIQACRELLKMHNCLIVIDGVQSTEQWDSIKAALAFEHDQNRSRIIVITNQRSVATYSWVVQGLEIEDALDLFQATASTRPGSCWPSEPSPAEIERAKSVLHKCGGHPKVIVAVANFFADGWIIPNDYFMKVLENHQAFRSLADLFCWVHSYFQSCPDNLKPCIFYLSIFPTNHNFRRRRLVRRWIAEGYSTDNKESTADEKGEEFFYELCMLNMIQVPGTTSLTYLTRMPLCQVNGFFREYIISRSMEENLVFALEGHCRANSQRSGRHLAIGSTWDRDMIVYQSIDFSKLRSLTVFGKWKSFFISEKMRILRVLDLEDASSVTDGDLEQMVRLLSRLKFLSLRGLKEITRVPQSIDGLRHLQTLDIRHTSVVTLPRSITKLQKLQHICCGTTVHLDDGTSTVESLPPPPAGAAAAESSSSMSRQRAATLVSWLRLPESRRRLAGSCKVGIEAPLGIGKMMALHNISVIDVSVASGQAVMEELKNLSQLRKLGVSGVEGENCKKLLSAISGHPNLKSLSVWLDRNQASFLDAISQPPEELEDLKLYGCVDKLPAWIKQLPNLRKLKLQMDKITQDDVNLLDLKWLNTLCLSSKEFQYRELRFRGPFHRLWVLEIDCNCRLQSVTFQNSSVMQQLEVLRIRCHNVSSLKFSGLQHLRKLREVTLSGSYDDNVKNHLKSELGKHPRDIKPVLKES
ncbi:hypothetical protein BS78_K068200 [Paspalum vaginatum]|uniref:NB-ARC domain-containing protein n=1 Tax=Paspalum vaginatum TaxID=158149 RepID=A0A9W7XA33_9POAL|nr:hypothetical protein BS78_K068200 [Paspalum vaginatum]